MYGWWGTLTTGSCATTNRLWPSLWSPPESTVFQGLTLTPITQCTISKFADDVKLRGAFGSRRVVLENWAEELMQFNKDKGKYGTWGWITPHQHSVGNDQLQSGSAEMVLRVKVDKMSMTQWSTLQQRKPTAFQATSGEMFLAGWDRWCFLSAQHWWDKFEVLCPVLKSSVWERYRTTGTNSAKGHKNGPQRFSNGLEYLTQKRGWGS